MTETQLFPPLNADAMSALRDSIRTFGVIVPVIVDQHGRMIDGHHRAEIAEAMGLDYPRETRHVADDNERVMIARDLNTARRHLSTKERRAIVLDLRSKGYSTRAIAAVTGDNQSTIVRDLAADGDASASPDNVIGIDGKRYPPRKIKNTDRSPAASKARREQIAALAAAGHSSRTIAEMIGITDKALRKIARREGIEIPGDIGGLDKPFDSTQVVSSAVDSLVGIGFMLDRVDYSALPRDLIPGWVRALDDAIRSLTTLRRDLKEQTQP